MSKQGYEPAPTAPLPTAPPPPYDVSMSQPPYNPHMENVVSPPYQYQPPQLVHESLVQGGQAPYPTQPYHPQPALPVVVEQQSRIVGVPLLVGPQSLRTTCPNCRTDIRTSTAKQSRRIAHLFCLGLCFIGCCLCSCIPYCMDSMKEVRHTCPKCKAYLGTYRC
ncbi:lipopolysaccharide-induced tumor necrosis factor-alpha factor homolog [Homalodisca vitripennis]|uniref:lipopolysaccharide-induced tumor necrosis factor-alpha factor homolog n=1 Tax=Homalodisca vitripennis TaxID=197043 RepID=UPI001EEBE9CD|nr:lipopolysaccharide-induced tumor necrosis factor-alpha factor homolog [Homalodisca vitripennis]